MGPGCDLKSFKATRAEIGKTYTAKKYEDGFKTATTLLTRCGDNITHPLRRNHR